MAETVAVRPAASRREVKTDAYQTGRYRPRAVRAVLIWHAVTKPTWPTLRVNGERAKRRRCRARPLLRLARAPHNFWR
eukprot:2654339-Prymnesium_polylepis.1